MRFLHTIRFSLVFLTFLGVLFSLSAFRVNEEPKDKAALGKKLFFEPMLSLDTTISCASCHRPEYAFADTSAVSIGVRGQLGTRNTPSAMNMAARSAFFYDGRVEILAEQVLHPIKNPVEMDLKIVEAVKRLAQHRDYSRWFRKLYKTAPDSASLSDALTTYIQTLESPGDAPADLWLRGVDEKAMTESQVRGRELFLGKGKCFDCHFSPDFTGDEFRNIGLYNAKDLNDVGRFSQTKDSTDLGKFKVPGLRNIALTAPYMHNGKFKTLAEVIDYYDNPNQFIPDAQNRDSLLQKPLQLTAQEKQDLVQFLYALTDKQYQK
ncbi:MAG: cytochrome-c peroxidase [Bacteroidia bacterium]